MITYLSSIVILGAVLIGQIFSLNGFYMRSPTFHVIMHLFGGLGIGLFILALIRGRISSRKYTIIIITFGTLAAGLFWEFIEAYYGISGYKLWSHLYYVDTARDLLNDVIGGCLVAFFSTKSNYEQ